MKLMDYEKELDKLRGCVCCSWLLALGNNHLALSQEKKKKIDSSLALHALLFDIGWYCFLHITDVPPVVRATRGPSKYLNIWDLSDDLEIVLPLNSMHQLIEKQGRTFTGWLGMIAWKPHTFPVRYPSWKEMPDELKVDCWHLVEVLKKL